MADLDKNLRDVLIEIKNTTEGPKFPEYLSLSKNYQYFNVLDSNEKRTIYGITWHDQHETYDICARTCATFKARLPKSMADLALLQPIGNYFPAHYDVWLETRFENYEINRNLRKTPPNPLYYFGAKSLNNECAHSNSTPLYNFMYTAIHNTPNSRVEKLDVGVWVPTRFRFSGSRYLVKGIAYLH